MKRKGMSLYFTWLLLLLALSACSPKLEFKLYEGKPLSIAVVGDPPVVGEEQVTFESVSFDELTSEAIGSYDAVIITEENLVEASESQYADVYLQSPIPIFFISASNPIPFTVKDVEYDASWGWAIGKSYAVGVLTVKEEEEDVVKNWGIGLYNSEKTEEHIKHVYSLIFKTIEEA
ncbi:hypothetical protein MHZ92_12045 [Sporosarcina sp. ACRSL]|uniref:hypothetical protein n=1 Tax=Sporosarcina sp. ACRSL TaxID=2918215 RepID=UPI001EF569AC|nr:hypothetical protein [Sporosarcina sp. ACRSL]MCG7344869.1 hypothetical protein [Sporosarcina sp. ACRSL]